MDVEGQTKGSVRPDISALATLQGRRKEETLMLSRIGHHQVRVSAPKLVQMLKSQTCRNGVAVYLPSAEYNVG